MNSSDPDLEKGSLCNYSAPSRQQLISSASDSSYFTDRDTDQNSSNIRRNDRAISTSLLDQPAKKGIHRKFIQAVIPRSWQKREINPPVPLFYCLICLENHAVTEFYTLYKCSENHHFCRSSIELYLESQFNSGILSFRCPHYGHCEGYFDDNELRGLMSEDNFTKYIRLKQMKTNPDLRECPNCTVFTTGSPSDPQILCSSCGTHYCYFHANAHPSMSCEEYQRLDLKQSLKSVQFIKRNTRKCPRCLFDTEKDGGCNHMRCASCGENWCWLCGRAIGENGEEHYTELGGCPGNQFTDGSDFAMWTILPCLRSPLWSHVVRLPYYLLLFIMGLIMFIMVLVGLVLSFALLPVTGPIACCLSCCCGETESSHMIIALPMYSVVFLTMGLIVFLLEMIWLPIGYVLSLFVLPLRLCFRREGETVCQSICDLYSFTDSGQPSIFWCPPIVAFMSLVEYIGSD